MADLELSLSWLGMSNYLERFIDAGFDSWGTILEITEDDLEVATQAAMTYKPQLIKRSSTST